jgi:hypothetical protein
LHWKTRRLEKNSFTIPLAPTPPTTDSVTEPKQPCYLKSVILNRLRFSQLQLFLEASYTIKPSLSFSSLINYSIAHRVGLIHRFNLIYITRGSKQRYTYQIFEKFGMAMGVPAPRRADPRHTSLASHSAFLSRLPIMLIQFYYYSQITSKMLC